MFGSKEASEDKLKKMVEKGKWDKLRKQYLDSDKTTQVALAKACAASRNDGSVNILTSLLEVDDVDVKIAAVTSLGCQDTGRSDGAESSDHKSAGEDCRKSIRAGSVKKRKGEEVSVKRSSFVFLLQGISESAPADCFCPNRNLTKS